MAALRIGANMIFSPELYKGTAMKRIRLIVMLVFALLLLCPGPEPSVAGMKISILQTGDISGHLFPCPT